MGDILWSDSPYGLFTFILITLVLGLLVLGQWPASGLWVIGLFIGIDLIFYGCAWIALALGLRSL